MLVLATISDLSRLALIIDTETRVTTSIPVREIFVDRTLEAPCRPFGITWSDTELFIANNLQLLVYDKRLKYLRTMQTPLQINTHQLAYHGGYVWAVSPRTNSLIAVHTTKSIDSIEFDLCNHVLTPHDVCRVAESNDRYHFNSLLWADDSLFVAAHNFGRPSFINRYDERTLNLDDVYHDVGMSIHGLAFQDSELYWISTQTNELRSSLGYRLPLLRSGYARGLAMTDSYFIVAISEFLQRDKRHGGDSWIQIIDRQQDLVVEEFHLAGTGSINDLRLLDDYDYGHWLDPLYRRR
jgi:hypothetical protein